MPPENDPSLVFILLAQTVILVSFAIVLRMRVRRDSKLGSPMFVRLDSGGFKPAVFALELGLFIVVAATTDFPKAQALLTLFGAIILTAFTPGRLDAGIGESGVLRGWYGRRFEELEEWRLTGQHLRFRLLGEWTAVEVPREKVGVLRRILSQVAPHTESEYRE